MFLVLAAKALGEMLGMDGLPLTIELGAAMPVARGEPEVASIVVVVVLVPDDEIDAQVGIEIEHDTTRLLVAMPVGRGVGGRTVVAAEGMARVVCRAAAAD